MPKEDNIKASGVVVDAKKNAQFDVLISKFSENDITPMTVLCHISWKIRQNYIKVIVGDNVEIEMSPYDLKKGRIVRRN